MILKIASLALILAFGLFCIWNRLALGRMTRAEREKENAFWERESEANSVRRKPIDHLDYVKIPDNLYFDLLPDNTELPNIKITIDGLRSDKILNLTGYTNTDLKFMYGTANITELSEYDQNYTTLVTTLQKWADILLDEDYEKEAVNIMEFLVSTNADIGRTYRMLGKYYLKNGKISEFESLIGIATELKSINSPYIVESLEQLKSL